VAGGGGGALAPTDDELRGLVQLAFESVEDVGGADEVDGGDEGLQLEATENEAAEQAGVGWLGLGGFRRAVHAEHALLVAGLRLEAATLLAPAAPPPAG
jgi:hypothetical protein